MTKENQLHRGDVWFNPSNPEKLVVFKKPDLTNKQKNMLQIAAISRTRNKILVSQSTNKRIYS